MSDIAFLSATELLGLYQSRKLSPVEATEAVLWRIERHDPRVNAYRLVDAGCALSRARESERRSLQRQPAGRLDGLPTSTKAVLLTRACPTLRGWRVLDT